MKTIGMSVAQHQKLGRALKDFEDEIQQALCLNAYGLSKPETKRLHRLLNEISETKNVMDNAVFREYPKLTTKELTGFYYGRRAAS